MDTTKRIILFLFIVLLLATGLSVSLYRDKHAEAAEAVLRVGAGDDVTGLLMEDLIESTRDTVLDIELNTFMDCCGNAAQWAMSTNDLDVGFYCGSTALTLVNHNSDLEIYGPAVLNAEVVALGSDNKDTVKTMALPMKRTFLDEIVYDNFPSVTEIVQVPTTSLHYALSGGSVDGAVVDIAKALQAPSFIYIPLSDEDHVSYCLVVNKNITDTPQFARFLNEYNQIAEYFNDSEYLKDHNEMNDSFWQTNNVKFLYFN